ncbi:hypothetical protein BJX64DRAFT_143107 [Aspergillus heterothallicus]
MAETISRFDGSGWPPTFSIIPPFIPAVIKRRLSSSRYAIIRTEVSMPSRTTTASVRNKLPRSPSTEGAARYPEQFLENASTAYEETVEEAGSSLEMRTADFEIQSGLRWNCVNPALSRLRLAGYEAQRPHCERSLVRSLYLEAVAYLLSGLPEDLTDEEAAKIRVPARSYVHRLLALSIVYFCLLLQFLMPFIKEVTYHLYQHERSLRLRERATALSLYIVERVSRGSVNFGSTLLSFYDGKMGDTASSATSWWVEGVAGGIYEGLEEGMAILGFKTPNSRLETAINNGVDSAK